MSPGQSRKSDFEPILRIQVFDHGEQRAGGGLLDLNESVPNSRRGTGVMRAVVAQAVDKRDVRLDAKGAAAD